MELKHYKALKAYCEQNGIKRLSAILYYKENGRVFNLEELTFYNDAGVVEIEEDVFRHYTPKIYQMFLEYAIFASNDLFTCRADHFYNCDLTFKGNQLKMSCRIPKMTYKDVNKEFKIDPEFAEPFNLSLKDTYVKSISMNCRYMAKQKQTSRVSTFFNSQGGQMSVSPDRIEVYSETLNKLVNEPERQILPSDFESPSDFSYNVNYSTKTQAATITGRIPVSANSELTYGEDIFLRLNSIEKISRKAYEQAKSEKIRADKKAEAESLMNLLESLFDPEFNPEDKDFTTLKM